MGKRHEQTFIKIYKNDLNKRCSDLLIIKEMQTKATDFSPKTGKYSEV